MRKLQGKDRRWFRKSLTRFRLCATLPYPAERGFVSQICLASHHMLASILELAKIRSNQNVFKDFYEDEDSLGAATSEHEASDEAHGNAILC